MLLKYILRFVIIAILATVIANLFDVDIQLHTITAMFNTIVVLWLASFITTFRKFKLENPSFSNQVDYTLLDRKNRYNFFCAFVNFILLFLLFGIEKFTINGLTINIMLISWLHMIAILSYYVFFLYKMIKYQQKR